MTYLVSSVQLGPDMVEVAFMEVPGDLRNEGAFVRTRSYLLYDAGPHRDAITDLREAINEFIKDVDEDWEDAPIHVSDDTDDDDEHGMGE